MLLRDDDVCRLHNIQELFPRGGGGLRGHHRPGPWEGDTHTLVTYGQRVPPRRAKRGPVSYYRKCDQSSR